MEKNCERKRNQKRNNVKARDTAFMTKKEIGREREKMEQQEREIRISM